MTVNDSQLHRNFTLSIFHISNLHTFRNRFLQATLGFQSILKKKRITVAETARLIRLYNSIFFTPNFQGRYISNGYSKKIGDIQRALQNNACPINSAISYAGYVSERIVS